MQISHNLATARLLLVVQRQWLTASLTLVAPCVLLLLLVGLHLYALEAHDFNKLTIDNTHFSVRD